MFARAFRFTFKLAPLLLIGSLIFGTQISFAQLDCDNPFHAVTKECMDQRRREDAERRWQEEQARQREESLKEYCRANPNSAFCPN